MRALRIAGIAEQRQHLTTTHLLSETDANAFRLQMSVKGEIALAQIENHIVAANGLQRDRHGSGCRFVLRYAVLQISDDSVSDGENFCPIRIPVRIVHTVAPKRFSIFPNSPPIGRETLRDSRLATNRNNPATMIRCIGQPASRQPAFAPQWRTQDERRAPTDHDLRAFHNRLCPVTRRVAPEDETVIQNSGNIGLAVHRHQQIYHYAHPVPDKPLLRSLFSSFRFPKIDNLLATSNIRFWRCFKSDQRSASTRVPIRTGRSRASPLMVP